MTTKFKNSLLLFQIYLLYKKQIGGKFNPHPKNEN